MRKAREIRSYTHPPLNETGQEPDTKPGDYYVSIIDRRGNDGSARYALALGPFRDDHAAALARVGEVRQYVLGHYARSAWWAFGTCRLDAADDNPTGKLNDVLGVEVAA